MKWLLYFRFYLFIAFSYYFSVWFLLKDTGSAMMILLGLLPVIVLLCSIKEANEKGFQWYFSIIVGLIFLPIVWATNSSAFFYVYFYALISYLGQWISYLTKKAK